MINATIRQRLVEETRDVQTKEIITWLYRDHPQGASSEGIKETLFLHDAFEESSLTRLVEQGVLIFDGKRYQVSPVPRQILDRDPTILLDEFLR